MMRNAVKVVAAGAVVVALAGCATGEHIMAQEVDSQTAAGSGINEAEPGESVARRLKVTAVGRLFSEYAPIITVEEAEKLLHTAVRLKQQPRSVTLNYQMAAVDSEGRMYDVSVGGAWEVYIRSYDRRMRWTAQLRPHELGLMDRWGADRESFGSTQPTSKPAK